MATQLMRKRCDCSGRLRQLDAGEFSETLHCPECDCCFLNIFHPRFRQWIPLRDFHLKRGEGPTRRPLDDLRMADRMVVYLAMDVWPTPAMVVDFGIDTPHHLGALQYAVRGGVTAYELDRVMGDGDAITRLVRCIPHQPYANVQFRTAYDDLTWDDAEKSAL